MQYGLGDSRIHIYCYLSQLLFQYYYFAGPTQTNGDSQQRNTAAAPLSSPAGRDVVDNVPSTDDTRAAQPAPAGSGTSGRPAGEAHPDGSFEDSADPPVQVANNLASSVVAPLPAPLPTGTSHPTPTAGGEFESSANLQTQEQGSGQISSPPTLAAGPATQADPMTGNVFVFRCIKLLWNDHNNIRKVTYKHSPKLKTARLDCLEY